jgi:hypothetical protein
MMAWLHDNGDDNEYSQFEDNEGGEKDEGLLEETEEEVIVSERPGSPSMPPSSAPKPKPRKPSAPKPKRKPAAKAKPRPKKKAAAKKSKKSSASSKKRSKSRKKR